MVRSAVSPQVVFLTSGSSRRSGNVSNIGERIGARIRDLRLQQAKPATQSSLARSAGISVSYLSLIERGQRVPPMHTLCAIAQTLEVPVAVLVSGVDPFDDQIPEGEDIRRVSDFIRRRHLGAHDVERLLRVARLMFEVDKR